MRFHVKETMSGLGSEIQFDYIDPKSLQGDSEHFNRNVECAVLPRYLVTKLENQITRYRMSSLTYPRMKMSEVTSQSQGKRPATEA